MKLKLKTTNYHISQRWLQAFNDHNLVNLLELYDENAVHFSPKLKIKHPETNGFIKGKEALKSWWEEAFERLPQLTYIEKASMADDEKVLLEYTRIVPGEENINVAEILEIKNGLIVASRVYHG